MDHSEFCRILATFTDRPGDFASSDGDFVVEIHDNIVEGRTTMRGGLLTVVEGDSEAIPAEEWIIKRLAQLDLLASRIGDFIQPEEHFVVPSGQFLDTLGEAPDESEEHVGDAPSVAREVLGRRPGGTSTVLYLTSDAGEGKTTLINELSRRQADAYRNRQSDWLLLPVSLGGQRSLLRFDDFIVATLLNRFRFPYLYYDALIELVRMGAVALALDGFEEMLVTSSGDEAITNLGGIVEKLSGSGALLIAARRAYFEYRSFRIQAQLFDALKGGRVSFSRLNLDRWRREQFLEYCAKAGADDPEDIYRAVSIALGEDEHPLLTRAVLVRRLVELASSVEDRDRLLHSLSGTPQEFFGEFISAIVRRETTEKWINTQIDPMRPLLDEEQHHDLLSRLAEEMWGNHKNRLGRDVVEVVVDIFCDEHQLTVQEARQIKNRVPAHALLVSPGHDKRGWIEFDHTEFQDYFLGRGLSQHITEDRWPDARRLLDAGVLSPRALETTSHFLVKEGAAISLSSLTSISQGSMRDSYVSGNCGALVIGLIGDDAGRGREFVGLTFPEGALEKHNVSGVRFSGCRFQPTQFRQMSDCVFETCVFERIEFRDPAPELDDVLLRETEVQSLAIPSRDNDVFDPDHVTFYLEQYGITVADGEDRAEVTPEETQPDEKLEAAQRMFKAFFRSFEIDDRVIDQKLRDQREPVMESLREAGVVEDVEVLSGRIPRIRLRVHMTKIQDALAECDGSFDDFVAKARRR